MKNEKKLYYKKIDKYNRKLAHLKKLYDTPSQEVRSYYTGGHIVFYIAPKDINEHIKFLGQM